MAAQRGCGAPSLEALGAGLDGALGGLGWWGAALPTARVGVGGLGGLFQPKPFYEFCGFYEKKMLVFIDLQWINSVASAVLTPVLPREHTVVALSNSITVPTFILCYHRSNHAHR